jgi:hypothetical protein
LRFGTSSLICLNSFLLPLAADKRTDMAKIIVVATTVNMNKANTFDSNVMTMDILFLLYIVLSCRYWSPLLVTVNI